MWVELCLALTAMIVIIAAWIWKIKKEVDGEM